MMAPFSEYGYHLLEVYVKMILVVMHAYANAVLPGDMEPVSGSVLAVLLGLA